MLGPALLSILPWVAYGAAASTRPWLANSAAPIEERVQALLSMMTLEAKVAQTLQLSDSQNENFAPPPAGAERVAWLKKTFPDGFGAMPFGWLGYVEGYQNNVDSQNAMQEYLLQNSTYGIPASIWTETLHTAQDAVGCGALQTCSCAAQA